MPSPGCCLRHGRYVLTCPETAPQDLLVLELQKANVQPQHACEVVAAAHHALSSGRQQLLSMSPEWSQRLRLEAATAAAGTMAALITKVQQALRDSSARQQLVTALQSSLGPESLAGKAAGMQQQVLYVARHLLEACQSDVLLLLGAIMLADMMAPGWARGLLSGSGQQRVTLTWLVEQYLADAEVALACSQHLPLQDLVLQLQLHAASKELSQVAAAASVKHCEGMLYVFKRLGLSVQQLESVQQDSAAEAEGSTAAPVEPAMQSSSSAAAMAKPLSAAAAVFVPAAGTMEQHVCSHVTAAVGLAERWASEADVAAGHGFPDTYSGHIAGALAVGKEAASSRQAELQPLFKTVSQLVAEAPRGGQDEAASAISHSSSSSSTATKAPEATPATRPGSSPSGRGSAPRRADSAESLEAALHLAVCNAAACSKTLAHAAASGGQLDAAGGQSVAEGLGGGLVATVNAVKQALAAATAARQALPRKTPALVFLGEALQRMDAVQPYLAQARQIVSQGGSGSEARSRQADLICEVQEELEYCVQAALLMRSLPLDPLDIKYLLAHHAQSSTGLALTAAQLGPRVPGSPLPSEFSTTEVVAWLLRLPGDEGWFHLLGIIKEDAKLLQQYAAAAVAAAAAGFILLLDTTGAERLTDEVKRELLMRAYTAHHYQVGTTGWGAAAAQCVWCTTVSMLGRQSLHWHPSALLDALRTVNHLNPCTSPCHWLCSLCCGPTNHACC